MKKKGAGDVWTWVALDPDTKLVPCWFIGQRDAGCAYHFMHDLAERLACRVQLTTDGHRAYLSAVEDAFGAGIDYAMLQKIYGQFRTEARNALQPGNLHGSAKGGNQWQSRPRSRFYVVCRAAESYHPHVHATIYTAHKRALKEAGKSRTRSRDSLYVLQLRTHSPIASRDAYNGSWNLRSRMVNRGNDGSFAGIADINLLTRSPNTSESDLNQGCLARSLRTAWRECGR